MSDNPTRPTNVLIVGVGGQGVIMVSKVLAMLAQAHGHAVKQSEVHGMAKRGGTVFSHVRFGPEIWSPTIPEGEADILVALEWAEALRWLRFMRPGSGTFIADTQRIVPPFACRARDPGAHLGYSRETPAQVLKQVETGYALDAGGMAVEIGNARISNTILLGVLSTALDFAPEDWLDVIRRFVPEKTIRLNEEAFRRGREWALMDPSERPAPLAPPVADLPVARATTALAIEAARCKGCDICVKVCPERCLALDDQLLAYLIRPEACTGCHVCEWLCPDFAITLTRTAITEAAE